MSYDLAMLVLCIARRFWQTSKKCCHPPTRNCFSSCALNNFLTIAGLLIRRIVFGVPSSSRLYFLPNNHIKSSNISSFPTNTQHEFQPSKRDTLFNMRDLRGAEQPTLTTEPRGNVTEPERHFQDRSVSKNKGSKRKRSLSPQRNGVDTRLGIREYNGMKNESP